MDHLEVGIIGLFDSGFMAERYCLNKKIGPLSKLSNGVNF